MQRNYAIFLLAGMVRNQTIFSTKRIRMEPTYRLKVFAHTQQRTEADKKNTYIYFCRPRIETNRIDKISEDRIVGRENPSE